MSPVLLHRTPGDLQAFRFPEIMDLASVVTSNPANEDHLKSGQRGPLGDHRILARR